MLGAVLAGGASRRMGTDKALVAVDGRPMARRVADALVAGGATTVCCIGGDGPALERLGLAVVADGHPGQGPLGAVATALEAGRDRGAATVLVAACDHPHLDGATVAALVAALAATEPDMGYAVPVDGGGRRPLLLALRPEVAAPVAAALFAAGHRSMQALLDGVRGVEVAHLDPRALRDVDHPRDLDGR